MPVRGCLLLSFLCVLPLAARASARPLHPRHDPAPDIRQALAGWSDSVERATTLPLLLMLDPKSHAAPSVSGVRRALYSLRHAELAHDRAELELVITNATVLANHHGDLAWGPYLLARAYVALQQGGWPRTRPDEGRAPQERYSDAVWRTLDEALQRDPQLKPAQALRSKLLMAGGDRLLRPAQIEMVRSALERDAHDADLLVVWARYLRMQRRYADALELFGDAAASGGDRSRIALERARTLRALHQNREASAAYWDGLAHLTPAGREMYRYDLAWIISADSLKAFDALTDSAVVPWMQRFWDERDAAAANHPGERLDEHLRRWDVAYARYRVASPWRRVEHTRIDLFFENLPCVSLDKGLYDLLWKLPPVHADDIRDDEWLLDHRGILYLRHGEPLLTVGSRSSRISPEDFTSGPPAEASDISPVWNSWDKFEVLTEFVGKTGGSAGPPAAMRGGGTESWVYLIDGEQRVIHFGGSDAIGMYAPTTLASVLPFDDYDYVRRSGLSADYLAVALRAAEDLRMPARVRDASAECWNETRKVDHESRVAANDGIRTDTDAPPFVHFLPAVLRSYALGDGSAEPGEAMITAALDGATLHGDSLDDGRVGYDVHFRAVAWNKLTAQTITIDTVRHYARPTVMKPGQYLAALFQLPLPPGDWQLAVRAQQGDSTGAMMVRRDLHVAAANMPALSDIVLGRAGEPGWTAPDGEAFPVSYNGEWPVHGTAEAYYEVYGVPAGETYRTTVAVRPLDPKNHAQVAIGFTDQSRGSVTTFRRSIDLATLPAGKYELVVTIRAAAGNASRTQAVVIVGERVH